MLQQTQVSRVVERFESFLRRFPTVAALAKADEQAVLAAWQGLGYYGRARRLHAAAKAIVERFGGEVPADPEVLRSLPGIGRYTAGAIASVGFGRREPIVDTNVVRVLMRVAGRPGPADDRANVAWAWERAAALVAAAGDPAAFNEGLMELGALLCPANGRPNCDACPVAARCAARAAGNPASIPSASKSVTRRRIYHHVVLVRREGAILLERRPERGLWAAMWQAPTLEGDERLDAEAIRARLAPRPRRLRAIGEFVHPTSHREVVFVVHEGTLPSGDAGPGRVWVRPDELDGYPLSNPMRSMVGEWLGGGDAVRPGPRAAGSASPSAGSGRRSGRGGSRRGS